MKPEDPNPNTIQTERHGASMAPIVKGVADIPDDVSEIDDRIGCGRIVAGIHRKRL
jgi:hypothetical protein